MSDVLPREVFRVEPALDRWGESFNRIDHADAWAIRVRPGEPEDPVSWAHLILGDGRGPVSRTLMRLRDTLVRPLGLETMTDKKLPYTGFPLFDKSDQAVLLGTNDNHLDFRVVVKVADETVTLTTVVIVHNWLGRLYWALVRFFHPVIVKASLRRAASNEHRGRSDGC